MLIIDTGVALARALDSPLHASVKRLLALRRDQLGGDIEEGSRFVIAQWGDAVATLETALAFPFTSESEPCFDWAADHGCLFELAFILSDDGAAEIVLVPDEDGIDPELIALCRLHAGRIEVR